MILTPERIGRYEIQGELGRGGMSTVYIGHDPHFGRDVAIKLLSDSLSDNRVFRTRFEREAKTIATLDHPAIVPVYDFGEDEEKRPFLVMRLMTGGTLSERLKQGPLPMQDILAFFQRIAPALDEAHTYGVIHRDLKPSNFLYDQRDVPFITDFGIAKLRDAQTQITQAGGMIGTPAYMSPEQIQARVVLDGRSDIYALGVLLYEMLTGSHPFHAETAISIAMKHLNDPIPEVAGLSAEWQAVVQKAMAKNREARYGTATALANDIAALITEVDDVTQTAVRPSLSPPANIHALLIVNTQYQHAHLKKLPQNGIDVPQLANALRPYCQEITTLTNLPFSDMRRAIGQLVTGHKANQTIWLYYIGHGLVDHRQQLYLTAVDTDPDILRSTALSATYISEELNSSSATGQILLLDCSYHHMRLNHTTPLPMNAKRGLGGMSNGRLLITTHTHAYPLYGKKGQLSHFSQQLTELLNEARATYSLRQLVNEIKGRLIRHDDALPNLWAVNETIDITLKRQHNLETPILNSAPVAISPSPTIVLDRPAPKKHIWLWAGGLLLLVGSLLYGGWFFSSRAQLIPTPTATEIPVALMMPTHTPTSTTTATATQTATPTPSPTATATQTASPTATATNTATATPDSSQATAELPSSIFSQPSTDSTELAIIQPEETVLVLGKAPVGTWLYVSNTDNIAGYVYAPRLQWEGNLDTLPIIQPDTSTASTPATNCIDACPTLEIDLYALPDVRCVGDTVYQQVFIGGRGGDGSYTYFWNGQQVASNRTNGHAFEVRGAIGATLIGTGEVRSRDGQTAVADLFLANLSCNSE